MFSPVPIVKNNLQNGIKFRTQPKFKWKVIEFLGSMGGGLNAGIAKVRTKDDPLGRVFIEKRFSEEDIFYKTAHKEMALLHQVGDHPFITRMVDHFVDERAKKASVYMEFCDTGSLLDVIMKVSGEGKSVSEHKLWQWFIQAMEALVYCHRGHKPDDDMAVMNWARIYHRDIKPGNLLLTRAEVDGKMQIVAKLADFGCAQSDEWTCQTKPASSASRASAVTPGFDPPEFPRFSGCSDVWQLAVVFVCVCGLPGAPRSRQNPYGIPWNKGCPAGRHYSKELNSVLKWCLTEDAKKRPEAMDALNRLKDAYNGIKTRLRPDDQPLEICDRSGGERIQLPQPMPQPRFEQHPRRPGPPRHLLSDPEDGRIGPMLNIYEDFVNDRRSPRGPVLGRHPLLRPRNALESMRENEEDDPRFHRGMDPGLLGGLRPHPGYFRPFHPAHDHLNRRYR